MWHRVSDVGERPKKPKRTGVSVTRSKSHPDIAYIMMPMDMAEYWSANIYHDGGTKIAVEFRVGGDYAVRRTSAGAFTVRINLPKRMAHLVPPGLNNVGFTRDPEGLIVIDLQTVA